MHPFYWQLILFNFTWLDNTTTPCPAGLKCNKTTTKTRFISIMYVSINNFRLIIRLSYRTWQEKHDTNKFDTNWISIVVICVHENSSDYCWNAKRANFELSLCVWKYEIFELRFYIWHSFYFDLCMDFKWKETFRECPCSNMYYIIRNSDFIQTTFQILLSLKLLYKCISI
jgi:hypothetical protein